MKLTLRIVLPVLVFAAVLLAVLRAPARGPLRGGERFREATHAGEAMRWLNRMRAHPTGKIPVDWRERALDQIKANALRKTSSAEAALEWVFVGPSTTGGRIRSVVIDPTNSANVYCGSVSGGIWKSTTAGSAWTPVSDFANNIVIGCMTIDPANPSIIYAGTGEGYFNYDYLRGAGVLKSTDAGASWSLLTNFASAGAPYYYYYINKILIKPNNSSVLYAGILGGVWKSTNAGANWSRLNVPSTGSTFCTDLAMDVQHPETLYAAFGLFSPNGIFKTTNGGSTWTKLTNGFPAASTGFHRISLAVAPSNPSIIYACLADSNDYTHSIQKSTDGGASWAPTATKPVDPLNSLGHLGSTAAGQGWYNNVIAVHPTDPNIVFTGGINLFKSVDGGATWPMKTNWYPQSPYKNMHADQHAIVFDPNNSNVIYFGNDGGMYKSTDGGENFLVINNNLGVTQFYSGAVNPSSASTLYYGGTQDVGTLRSGVLPTWAEVSFGGDGGVVQVDSAAPQYVYLTYSFLGLQRSGTFGAFGTFTQKLTGIPNSGGATTDRCSFIAPFVIDASNTLVLYAGTFKIYRTVNRGDTWTSISADLTGDGDGSNQVGSLSSTVSAIAVARSSPATIYVGTTGSTTTASRIQVTTNTGSIWANVTAAPLPNRSVMSIAVDPGNRDRAFAGFSGYNASTPTAPGHVFLTTNRGASWANASGNLPDVPVNALLLDPNNANHLFAGTDLGVFESLNAGATWVQQNAGMANVAVFDLDLRSDLILFAATHGRGMFRTASAIVGVADRAPDVPAAMRLDQNYPNPFNPQTVIGYEVAGSGRVTLKVYDLSGREVATLVDREQEAGRYEVPFDASGLASGVYIYRLAGGGGVAETKRMVLIK